MTPAEITRAVTSKRKVMEIEAREKATYDYIQAGLIVKGISIILGGKESYPPIEDVYPSLFADDFEEARKQEIQKKKDSLSALRFIQFAQSYNNKFNNKEVLKKTDE